MSNNFETRKYCSNSNLKKGEYSVIHSFFLRLTNRQTPQMVMTVIQKRTVSSNAILFWIMNMTR